MITQDLDYADLHGFAFYYCLKRMGHWQDAEDAAQRTMLRFIRMREGLSDVESLRGLIAAIARYEILIRFSNLKRRREREMAMEPVFRGERIDDNPLDERRAIITKVDAAIDSLEPKWRRQIHALMAGVTRAEMAERDGVNRRTVDDRRHNAMRRLKSRLMKAGC